MREIKFRVWCVTNSKMKDRVRYANRDSGILYCPDYEDDANYILMQYTGLKDKNGKEIYEGDIICDSEKLNNEDRIPTVVRWGNTPYTAAFNFGHQPPCHLVEIIGNIYENPELI